MLNQSLGLSPVVSGFPVVYALVISAVVHAALCGGCVYCRWGSRWVPRRGKKGRSPEGFVNNPMLSAADAEARKSLARKASEATQAEALEYVKKVSPKRVTLGRGHRASMYSKPMEPGRIRRAEWLHPNTAVRIVKFEADDDSPRSPEIHTALPAAPIPGRPGRGDDERQVIHVSSRPTVAYSDSEAPAADLVALQQKRAMSFAPVLR